MKKIHFETDKGEMVAELYDDDAPETVANFVGLAMGTKEWTDPKTGEKHKGKPYFDGLRFHRVVSNFVIQGGDPFTRYDDQRSRWGTGGPGFKIKDELSRQEAGPQARLALDGARRRGHGRLAVLRLPLAAAAPRQEAHRLRSGHHRHRGDRPDP